MPSSIAPWAGCCKSFFSEYVLLSLITVKRFYSENDITDVLYETFTTTEERFGEMVTIDLKPGGESIPVTEQNKKEYVDSVVDYRISQRVKQQFDSFMEGLLELIPRDLINVFDERELELLIGGMAEIDM
jgi:E3 ubiquitin-protein ligase NEDD4